jgi:hypothetical protein
MGAPYASLPSPIPVTVATTPVTDAAREGVAIIRMEPSRHDHGAGAVCLACAAQTDIRALLFDLLESWRQGSRPAFTSVIVDASALADAGDVVDRLTAGKLPALGLRDHAVARNFYLSEVP